MALAIKQESECPILLASVFDLKVEAGGGWVGVSADSF
jgi:hypothetical protein